jgi:hypothetical protein
MSSIYRAPAGIEISNANTKKGAYCGAVHRTGQLRLHVVARSTYYVCSTTCTCKCKCNTVYMNYEPLEEDT